MLLTRQSYRFGRFRMDRRERILENDGIAVPVGPKVFDALLLMVESGGTLVERATMRERLWPGQIVEDGTLARVIADIRKALGDTDDERRYIETVPKFGYRFLASVAIVKETPQSASPSVQSPPKAKWIIPVGIGFISLVVAGFVVRGLQPHPPGIPSLLILPFQVIGNAPDGEMLCAGLQDSLTMELSGLSGLTVISLKPTVTEQTDIAEIGRRRRAGFILAGTIQLSFNRIHLNARLLRSETGQVVWAQQFEEHLEDLFLVESHLAKLTVSNLLPVLPTLEKERFARRLPTNAAAYRYYLLGRHFWNKRDANSYVDAIEMFTKAVAADPLYAPGYVGLADSYLLASGSQENGFAVTLPEARLAVERAIQIDPSLGEAHATLAMIASSYYFDWDTAEKELTTAIRLSPNYVTAHHWYAEFLTMRGKFKQSEAEFEGARSLDPASPIILTDLAQLYNFERKYQRSIETLDEALRLDPSFHLAHERKAYALMLTGRPQEALVEFETANRQSGARVWISEKAWVAAAQGKRQEAMALARQAELDDPNPFVLSLAWTELGEFDQAMKWLQKMYDFRSGGLISLKVNPAFDRLRSYKPFRALLQRTNMN